MSRECGTRISLSSLRMQKGGGVVWGREPQTESMGLANECDARDWILKAQDLTVVNDSLKEFPFLDRKSLS